MAKGSVYYCSECGYKSVKWAGKCPQCGAWSSFEEVEEMPRDVKKQHLQFQLQVELQI